MPPTGRDSAIDGRTRWWTAKGFVLITNVPFFQIRQTAVLICAARHFGAAVPLGILTASIVSRLRFLGVRAAGATIALFGGFATAFMMFSSSTVARWLSSSSQCVPVVKAGN
jgi:hypothetical protein